MNGYPRSRLPFDTSGRTARRVQSALLPIGRLFFELVQMEFVQKAMEDRRKRNSGDGDDCQSAIQCIQAGKELSARRLRLFYRTHAAQKHCGVEECVEPTQSLQFVVSHHSGQ